MAEDTNTQTKSDEAKAQADAKKAAAEDEKRRKEAAKAAEADAKAAEEARKASNVSREDYNPDELSEEEKVRTHPATGLHYTEKDGEPKLTDEGAHSAARTSVPGPGNVAN